MLSLFNLLRLHASVLCVEAEPTHLITSHLSLAHLAAPRCSPFFFCMYVLVSVRGEVTDKTRQDKTRQLHALCHHDMILYQKEHTLREEKRSAVRENVLVEEWQWQWQWQWQWHISASYAMDGQRDRLTGAGMKKKGVTSERSGCA